MSSVDALHKFLSGPSADNIDGLPKALEEADQLFRHMLGGEEGTEALELCQRLMESIAMLARDPGNRGVLGSQGSVETAVQWLKTYQGDNAHTRLCVDCLRVLCNVCADNDQNRQRFLDSDGPAVITRIIVDSPYDESHAGVIKSAYVCAFNTAKDFPQNAKAFIAAGAVDPHMRLFDPSRQFELGEDLEFVRLVALRSVENMAELDEFVKAIEGAPQSLVAMIAFLAKADQVIFEDNRLEVLHSLIWIVHVLLEKSGDLAAYCSTPRAILELFGIIEIVYNTADDLSNDEEEEETVGGQQIQGPTPRPPSSVTRLNRKVAEVTQILVTVSGVDQALPKFLDDQQLVSQLLSYLRSKPQKVVDTEHLIPLDEARLTAAALCLGNLARTDLQCKRLVEEHSDVIQSLIDSWLLDGGALGHVQARHALTGLLKNLSIPVENRATMIDLDLHVAASRFIDSAVPPLQVNCLSIIKLLTAQGVQAFDAVLSVLGVPSEMLLSPTPRTRKGEGEGRPLPIKLIVDAVLGTDVPAVRCEGARALVNVIARSFINMASSPKQSAELQTRAVTVISRGNSGASYPLVEPLVRVLVFDGMRHRIILHEALKGLVILTAVDPARYSYSVQIVEMLDQEFVGCQQQSVGEEKEENKEEVEETSPPKALGAILVAILGDQSHETYAVQTYEQVVTMVRILADTYASSPSKQFVRGKDIITHELVPLLPPVDNITTAAGAE